MNPLNSAGNAPAILNEQLAQHRRVKLFSQRFVYTFCILGIIFLIVFDFLLATDAELGNTWSELMREHGQRHLILPWLCGVLIGHLYHHHDALSPRFGLSDQQAYNTIGWISVGIVIFGWITQLFKLDIPVHIMTITAIAGIAAGYYIWPVKREIEQWKW